MIKTKSLITGITDVPYEWVFEYYLKLNEKLNGQDLKIKSVFSNNEKTPSFCVYFSKTNSKYQFKDFSSGFQGDAINLVLLMYNLPNRGQTAYKIIEDYNQFILNNKEDYSLREFKVYQKYKVSEFVIRPWTNLDAKFWTKFHINSKILEKYNVSALSSYLMRKEVDGEIKELLIKSDNIYGYFRSDGTLYKIYQPLVKDNKFIKISEYIQGTDQLTYQAKLLVICSSLKDTMAFIKLGYDNVEAVAPDSENTLIPLHIMSAYSLKYKNICTLFDNDVAGIKAMENYKVKYNIPSVLLPLSKDLSDSMRDFGIMKVKEALTPLLKEVLK